jgi:hypothetical protein
LEKRNLAALHESEGERLTECLPRGKKRERGESGGGREVEEKAEGVGEGNWNRRKLLRCLHSSSPRSFSGDGDDDERRSRFLPKTDFDARGRERGCEG